MQADVLQAQCLADLEVSQIRGTFERDIYVCKGYIAFIGVPLWGPHKKDYSKLKSMFGFPYFWKRPLASSKSLHAGCCT